MVHLNWSKSHFIYGMGVQFPLYRGWSILSQGGPSLVLIMGYGVKDVFNIIYYVQGLFALIVVHVQEIEYFKSISIGVE